MEIIFKILAVMFGIGFLGQLLAGELFLFGLILAGLFGYLGWKEKKEPQFDEVE